MWTHVDRGRGGKKRDFSVDVINGWPLIRPTIDLHWTHAIGARNGISEFWSPLGHLLPCAERNHLASSITRMSSPIDISRRQKFPDELIH